MEITITELLEMRIVVAAIVAVMSFAIHLLAKKYDKPWAKDLAKEIAKSVRDSNTDASWSVYFDMFYRAVRSVKHRDPDESEWDTAVRTFQEELLEDELEKENGSEAES